MTKEVLREAVQRQPFRPFSLRMADGATYHVPARDFVSLSPNGRTVIVFGEENKLKILDAMLITEIETAAV